VTKLRPPALVALAVAILAISSCDDAAPSQTTDPTDQAPSAAGDTITLGSLNLQVFGPAKTAAPAVLGVMGQIIRHYDIIAVQEIRDAGGTAVVALTNAVNSMGTVYDYEIGPR
jgi:hypothetical protein